LKISTDGSSPGLVFILANQPIMLTFVAPFALLHGKELGRAGLLKTATSSSGLQSTTDAGLVIV
jgi:hypothetical protein